MGVFIKHDMQLTALLNPDCSVIVKLDLDYPNSMTDCSTLLFLFAIG